MGEILALKKYETDVKPVGVVVLVHGALEHHGRYTWLVSKWNSEGYHVISGDLIGQGMKRENPGHIDSFDQYTHQVRAWIFEAHQYDLPVFLFGHSLGALILIRSLQRNELEIAGLILSSPILGLVKRNSSLTSATSSISRILNPKTPRNFGIEPGMVTRNVELITESDPLFLTKVSAKWYRELNGAVSKSFDEIGSFCDVPLLILQSGDDLFVDKKKVRMWFDMCKATDKHYKEWRGLYHELFNEPEREEVFNYTMKFVDICLLNIGYEV